MTWPEVRIPKLVSCNKMDIRIRYSQVSAARAQNNPPNNPPNRPSRRDREHCLGASVASRSVSMSELLRDPALFGIMVGFRLVQQTEQNKCLQFNNHIL